MKTIRSTGLEYLEGDDLKGYLLDMYDAQYYASLNRDVIMFEILSLISKTIHISERIETIHNYIDRNDGIIRKGAIKSYIGNKMIIPFNMRDGILICEGKSNPEWNYSAPHGSGRVHSRSKAKVELNFDKFKKDMNGIFTTSVCMNTIDESPDAYKDSKIIEEAIEPTAIILDRIVPIHNMKDIS